MANRKLGRTTDIRMSMLKTLTTDLIMYGKITTTETRAKEVKKIADSIIALAVKEKDKKLKFKMIFVGTGQDENDLLNYINELEISDNVIMAGKITDREELAKYYARADLFLFPSLYDASSIVQIESASQKTPGVFLKGSATSATVTDNVNGFISENTIGAYSDKIIEVMNDDKLLNKVKENAFIDLYVTWDKKVDEVYRIYLKKIKENKHKIL